MAILVAYKEVNAMVSDFLYAVLCGPRSRASYPDHGLPLCTPTIVLTVSAEVTAAVDHLLSIYGQPLVDNLLSALTGAVPSFMMADLSDVFWELSTVSREKLMYWVQSSPRFDISLLF